MKETNRMIHNTLLKISILAVTFLLVLHKPTFAQNQQPTTFGKVSTADFTLPANKIIDSNTNAVIISDVGSTEFVGNKYNWVSYVFKKTTRIKILTNKGFDLATIHFYLRGIDEWQDRLSNLQATTYNLEDGKVVGTQLSTEDLFEEKINKNFVEKKFTFPKVKNGSIIEYTYTINSRHFNYIPEWNFQDVKYPCLYSEFQIGIPDMLRYTIIRHGIDSFSSTKNDESHENLIMTRYDANDVSHYEVATNVYKQKWIIKDVMPLKNENYVNYPRDYLDNISFNLSQTYNGAEISSHGTNWQTTEADLLKEKEFGNAIDVVYTENLKNIVQKICGDQINAGEDAKKIFYYIRDNFTCVPDNSIYTFKELYDVNQAKSGTVADLNLLLIAMLRQRGLKAYPVILGTKEYGTNSYRFPVLEKMNYVVCMLKMFGDTIYLDASKPLNGYGKLPIDCYNGHARIINENSSGSVFFFSDAIKESKVTSLIVTNNENGKGLSGGFQSNLGYFESYKVRSEIKKIGQKAYLNNVQTSYGSDYTLSNFHIDTLTKLDEPIIFNYDLVFNTMGNEDIFYFNPILNSSYKENPFRSEERRYPVELPYPIDDIYVLNMEIPKGYKIDELPVSTKVAFNGTDGFYEYIISKDESSIQLRSHIKIKQATFAPDDYKTLRDFFAYIIKKQSEQIVFKKIK